MNSEERNRLISNHLRTIIEEGGEFSYLVSKKKNTEKMIMYTGSGNKVTLDIPFKVMRQEEKNRFFQEFPSGFKRATYAFTKETTIEEATEISEKIFRKVFQAEEDFSLEIEVELD